MVNYGKPPWGNKRKGSEDFMRRWIAAILVICISSFALTACAPKIGGGNTIPPGEGGNAGKGGAGNAAGRPADYAGAYSQLSDIVDAMTKTLDDMAEQYSETEGDDSVEMVMLLPLLSIDLALTATFNEDPGTQAAIETVFGVMGSKGAKYTRNGAHNYTVTFTNSAGIACEINAKFDPATGSLQMIYNEGGALKDFYEFVGLGGDKYAFLTSTERAVAAYAGGEIKSFSYSLLRGEEKYELSGSIYPGGSGASESWVIEKGVDAYAQCYQFDGSVLKFDADPFLGDRISVEMHK